MIWEKSKILSKDDNISRWILGRPASSRERSMSRDTGQFKLSSYYIPILSDRPTAGTPSMASQRQSEKACSNY